MYGIVLYNMKGSLPYIITLFSNFELRNIPFEVIVNTTIKPGKSPRKCFERTHMQLKSELEDDVEIGLG